MIGLQSHHFAMGVKEPAQAQVSSGRNPSVGGRHGETARRGAAASPARIKPGLPGGPQPQAMCLRLRSHVRSCQKLNLHGVQTVEATFRAEGQLKGLDRGGKRRSMAV